MSIAVGYKVRVVGHYHVSENKDLTGLACFINRIANDLFDRVFLENGKAVFGDRG